MYPFLFSNLGNIKEYESGEVWDKNEFFKHIEKRILIYKNLGITPNSKVIIAHGNNIRFFADLFALWHINAVAICIDNNIGLSEFKNIKKVCSSNFVIYKKEIPNKIISFKNKLKFINTDNLNFPKVKKIAKNKIDLKFNLDKTALILFTSGTTGIPKGVVHTFRSLISKWISLKNSVPLKYMKNSMCMLPTNFGHGLICNCLYPLVNGKSLLILPKFSVSILSKLNTIIDENKISYLSSVPSVWKTVTKITKKPKKNTLKLITCGSAPLSAFLWKQIQSWSSINRVWNTYGITETGSWIAGTQGSKVIPKDGFIGKGWGTNILITKDIKDIKNKINLLYLNRPIKKNEKGYIWVQTTSLMKGYLKQTALTNKVIYGSWFFTGDIGFLDSNYNLIITGRVRNEINTGGIKVMPEDIDIILEKHNMIEESCTFGVPDELAGEKVATAIMLKKGSKLSSNDLFKWIIKYISDYKAPKIWYKVNKIPKTSRGKVNREEVAKFCSNLKRMS
jgi:acyl-CoA synthetase (AMP-forming)/AMP-acid ligase II